MNKLLIAVTCLALVFAGCKEHDTPLIPSGSGASTAALAADSLYMVSPVPAAAPHIALVEDFSGQSCTNCPAAHSILDGLVAGGHTIGITYYFYGSTQTFPDGGAYDFRDSIGNQVAVTVYQSVPLSEIPVGGVDRVPASGNIVLEDGSWGGAVTTQSSLVDSMNLSVVSSFNTGNDSAIITATATYVQSMSTLQNLSIVIVEDSITDFQLLTSGTDSTYLFTDVFRDMVTAVPLGDPVLDTMAMKTAGTALQRRYRYKLRTTSPAINPAHCRVIAFLNSSGTGGDYHVIQTTQCKFAP